MANNPNNNSLSEFIKNNKDRIYNIARSNTILNEENKPTISRDDDWFDEETKEYCQWAINQDW